MVFNSLGGDTHKHTHTHTLKWQFQETRQLPDLKNSNMLGTCMYYFATYINKSMRVYSN